MDSPHLLMNVNYADVGETGQKRTGDVKHHQSFTRPINDGPLTNSDGSRRLQRQSEYRETLERKTSSFHPSHDILDERTLVDSWFHTAVHQ